MGIDQGVLAPHRSPFVRLAGDRAPSTAAPETRQKPALHSSKGCVMMRRMMHVLMDGEMDGGKAGKNAASAPRQFFLGTSSVNIGEVDRS